MIFDKIETRALTLEQLIDTTSTDITKEQALGIESVGASVNLITNLVGNLKVKLYKEKAGKTEEVIDYRNILLNKNTGDTLSPSDFKKAMLTDYLLDKGGYAFLNKHNSINYVDCKNVTIINKVDPIFKDFDITVNGENYLPFQFLRLLKNTKDGAKGYGLLQTNSKALDIAYKIQEFESKMLISGGNKKGFLKSKGKLSPDAMTVAKNDWNEIHNTGSSSVMILNEGIDFVETQATALEMQINEAKTTSNNQIFKLFSIPSGLFDGNITEKEFDNFIKTSITPVISAFEDTLNDGFLTEMEKNSIIEDGTNYYWQFETNDLLKGSLLERYQAYQIAMTSGFMTKNEVRNKENLEEIDGLDIIAMSLGDVIFDVKTKTYFTPNMDSTNNMDASKKIDTTIKEVIK